MVKKIFVLLYISTAVLTFAQAPNPEGWWKFDDPANLTKAETGFGSDLTPMGSAIQAVAGPAANNGAVQVGVGSYFKMTHGMAANGGGSYVNEYSLQFDFQVPALGAWYCFFQTSTSNANDGDCFINKTGNIGVGATGYTGFAVTPGEWYRLVVTVQNGTFYRYYLDGQLVLTGSVQSRDGRFSLDKTLLVFADENGEDGPINCAELAIWDTPLNASQVRALGGFGHYFGPRLMTRIPYLQEPTSHSMYVCWHDTADTESKVEYGVSAALGQETAGSSELISAPYRWHAVKLDGLQPNTEYYYRVVSGTGRSAIYNFRTLPEAGYTGKARMLLLSDTHSTDSTAVTKVLQAAKRKIGELYGTDLQNQLNVVLHSGDIVVSGSTINQYTDEYFSPISQISPYVPFMVTAGNHEAENAFYYKYMKYDDVSALTPPNANAEKIWWFSFGNTCIIALNTNIVATAGALQKSLLDVKLSQLESDPSIDFVFLMMHHPPYTELWGEALTFDAGPKYVSNELFPIIKKYSKVQQLTYGHTHAFERGTIESNMANGDFRIVCAGGGGGETDNWGEFQNIDYPFIDIALDHYHFQIVDIDMAAKSYTVSMYSLGNASKWRDCQLMDRWYRKLGQAGPDAPIVSPPSHVGSNVILDCSPFSGPDSLMTIRVQISDNTAFKSIQIDTMAYWRNIYGVDANFEPIDRNKGIDLTRLSISDTRFASGKVYYYRVRYRDHNLKWSPWSNAESFTVETGVGATGASPLDYELAQNYPNPFNNNTVIPYQIPKTEHVSIRVFNLLGQKVLTLVDHEKVAGKHEVELDTGGLSSGWYYYEMCCGDFKARRKFNLLK